MAPTDSNLVIAAFQLLHAADPVHGSRVRRTFRVDGREHIPHHHAARIVLVEIGEQLGQCEAVRLVDFTQGATRIHYSIYPGEDFLLRIVV